MSLLGCNGVRVCGVQAVFKVPCVRLQNLWERNCRVNGTQCSSSDAKATVRKMSAARSLFLADQLLARYFSPISAISVRSETED